MKLRSLMLALVLVAGISLSSPAFAQNDKPQTQTPSSQPQPADQKSTTAADQSQAQPADQKPAATDQNASQPVADQAQPADQSKDAEKKEAKNKHSGGKDDVDAIGNRKVAGWDWYSIESEIRMGKEYATQIEASLKLVTDPTVNEYINRVGQNLVRNSDAKVP